MTPKRHKRCCVVLIGWWLNHVFHSDTPAKCSTGCRTQRAHFLFPAFSLWKWTGHRVKSKVSCFYPQCSGQLPAFGSRQIDNQLNCYIDLQLNRLAGVKPPRNEAKLERTLNAGCAFFFFSFVFWTDLFVLQRPGQTKKKNKKKKRVLSCIVMYPSVS